jgi:hypothetical protein
MVAQQFRNKHSVLMSPPRRISADRKCVYLGAKLEYKRPCYNFSDQIKMHSSKTQCNRISIQ